jgi:hypothetical protein
MGLEPTTFCMARTKRQTTGSDSQGDWLGSSLVEITTRLERRATDDQT